MATSAADGEAQLAILRVARALLEVAAPADTETDQPEWIRKLVVAQACIQERIGMVGDGSLLLKASNILQGGLRSHPILLEVYLDTLTAEESSNKSLVALSAVTSFALHLPQYNGECGVQLVNRQAACSYRMIKSTLR